MPTVKKRRVRIDLQAKLGACGHWISTIAFDRTGERMAFASEPVSKRRRKQGAPPPERPVRVWVARVRDGAILHEFVMPTRFEEMPDWDQWPNEVAHVALDFSPDGTLLAVAWDLETLQNSEASVVALFDLERGGMVREIGFMTRGEVCFSPDSRWLVVAVDEMGIHGRRGTHWLSRDEGWEGYSKGPSTPGSKVAFSADGKRLIVVDDGHRGDELGVIFVRAGSHKPLGRSFPIENLYWSGPLAVAPDGRWALGECTVWYRVKKKRTHQDGVWRWRPDAAPERVTAPPVSLRETASGPKKVPCVDLVWIDPEGRDLLWRDGNGELVRQRIGQRRVRPIPLAPASAWLKKWEIKVSPDGERIARVRDDQVVFTRLRRRARRPA